MKKTKEKKISNQVVYAVVTIRKTRKRRTESGRLESSGPLSLTAGKSRW